MTLSSLSRKALQQFIDDRQIEASILPMDRQTPTVKEAALALNVQPSQIIKSLVFLVKDEPILVITNGLDRVDRRKLAAHLAVGRSRVKFASGDKALEVTGYVVGSMPPFGHHQKMRTFVDKAVLNQKEIFGGGGAIDTMMHLTSAELLRTTSAEALELTEENS